MAIDYQVIDSQGALVNQSFPYTREFLTFNRSSADTAYLTLSAFTGYNASQPSEIANVLVNGTVVGSIPPTFLDAATENPYGVTELTLLFSNSVLAPPIFPLGFGFNILQILPQGDLNDPNNYVIVWAVICTYKQ
jgi:hypothetical protein